MLKHILFEIISVDLILLITVYKFGGKTRVYDIVLSTGLDPSTIYHHLRNLHRRKLVELRGDMIVLTPKAREGIEYLRRLLQVE